MAGRATPEVISTLHAAWPPAASAWPWLPPRWLDADRRPMRNSAHHLTDFEFGVAA
jgi:hypothetical protein